MGTKIIDAMANVVSNTKIKLDLDSIHHSDDSHAQWVSFGDIQLMVYCKLDIALVEISPATRQDPADYKLDVIITDIECTDIRTKIPVFEEIFEDEKCLEIFTQSLITSNSKSSFV